ncbi:DM13 domain-containing protein [Rossellomorea sp. FM04394]|uniref:DM13 domain-containing protein n=1 Tax=Rossellomorea sp. FM04394 TaxID=3243076 RepID=UPI0035A6B8E5
MIRWMIGIAIAGALGVGWWLISPLFLDKVVNESAVSSSSGSIMKDQGENSMKETDSSSPDEMTNDTMEINELVGTFQGADENHEAKGKVSISEKNIRLENFEVTNGPDLYVYLVEEGQKTKEGISLGKLKGNIGNQNYEIPGDHSASSGMDIVIWCKQFNVDFGRAELGKAM